MNWLSQWKTRDLIVMAVLAVAVGVIFVPYSALYILVEGILGQVGGMILLGFFYLTGILVAYVVRKPGAATISSGLAALVEMLLGSPYGIDAVWVGLLQGLGAEVVFAARAWKDWRLVILAVAAVMSGIFGYAFEYVRFSYAQLEPAVQIGFFLMRIPSAIVLAGWLGKVLGDALAATGALRGLAISKR